MKCPESGMKIPNEAKRCPYCRQPIDPTQQLFGFFNQRVDDWKKGGEKGRELGRQLSSNSGCMVFLPLLVVAAYSIYYVISAC